MDIKTISALLFVETICFGLVLAGQYRDRENCRGAVDIGRGMVLTALSFLSISLQKTVHPLIAIPATNVLIVAGACFINHGFRQFFGAPRKLKACFYITFASLAIAFYFSQGPGSYYWRVVLIGVICSVILIDTARLLFFSRGCANAGLCRWSGALISALAFMFLVRIALCVYFPDDSVENMLAISNPLYFSLARTQLLLNFVIIIFIFVLANAIVNSRLDSELRKSADHFRRIFELAPYPVLITELSTGRIFDVNQRCVEAFKTCKEFLVGRRTVELGILDAGRRASIIEGVKNSGVVEDIDLDFDFPGVGPVHYTACCCLIEVNGQDCLLTSMVDMTLRKRYEQEILASRAKLLQTVSDRNRLFSIIAHDLSSPLMAIPNLTKFFIDNYDGLSNEEIKDSLRAVFKTSNQVCSLLDNLLAWSSSVTGRMDFKPADCELRKMFETVLELYSQRLGEKALTVDNRVDEGMKVFCDRKMIETVIRNLVANAVKFTPEGGRVEISAFREREETVFSIRDTGRGMDAEKAERLFAGREISSTPGTAGERGTGLGLMIVREFVERHGGKVSAESAPGRGSVFTVRLSGGGAKKAEGDA